jgi:ligand-binding sensor domain-containing protein
VRDGFARGFIYAIAQTPDGYLWVGTEFGLLRFDGVRPPLPWRPPAGEQLPGAVVQNLLVTRDGALWIGTLRTPGSAHFRFVAGPCRHSVDWDAILRWEALRFSKSENAVPG